MGMAEYIEREATVELLRNLGSRDYRREKGTIQEAIKMVSFSEYTPAADVAPVRHGRWKPYHEADIGYDEYGVRCSNCKFEVEDHEVNFIMKYCPNCGAKMDGGTDR